LPERDGYIAGVPCWVDTAQPGPEAAAEFNGGLFGSEFEHAMPAAAPGMNLVQTACAGAPSSYDYTAATSPPRMEWKLPWVSSLGSDFRYDFGAAFTEEQQKNGAVYNFRHEDEVAPQREGMSAFILQDGVVHHTYSTYTCGVEQLMGTFGYLDVSPLGRNEDPESTGAWWHRHDEYETLEATRQ
jgi:predicted dithiol-disulfide oxidoreductase (DUF899 family)